MTENKQPSPVEASAMLELAYATGPNYYRDLAQELLQIEEVRDAQSTFTEAQSALAKRYAPKS